MLYTEWKWFFYEMYYFYLQKQILPKKFFEFKQSHKRSVNVMTRGRVPNKCERCKTYKGIYDVKNERILPRIVKQTNVCLCIHRNHYCIVWRKNTKDSLLNGVNEMERNFKYVKTKIKGNILNHRIRNRFPKHGIIDQLENVFVFHLETRNDQKIAEAYGAGFLDINRLRDRWDKDITPAGIQTKKNYSTVFSKSCGKPVMNLLKYIPENNEGDERTSVDKGGDETASSCKILL